MRGQQPGRRLQLVSAAPRSGPTTGDDDGARLRPRERTTSGEGTDARAGVKKRAAPQGEVEGGLQSGCAANGPY